VAARGDARPAGLLGTAILGRALSARTGGVGKERLVVISGVASLAGCLIRLRLVAAGLAAARAHASGFSAIFLTMLAIAGIVTTGSPTVFGPFTVGCIGSITFPWASPHLVAFGVRLGMLVLLAGTVLVTACAVSSGAETLG
jgi:hypothetical protein